MQSYVASYCHNVNANSSGGAIVRVSAQTDFAVRTDAFANFAKVLAMKLFVLCQDNSAITYIHGKGEINLSDVFQLDNDLEQELAQLAGSLKEIIKVESGYVYNQNGTCVLLLVEKF